MPIRLAIEAKGDHLRFEVTGERDPGTFVAQMLDVWRRVAEQSRATGLDRVLGVSRVTGPTSTVAFYQIATELPGILTGCKVALAVLSDRDAVRGNLFGENVAVNRGVHGRVFEDEARALEWLLEP